MDGTRELMELAELLRLGAKTARQIAILRSTDDAVRIEALIRQAEMMALEIDAIVSGRPILETGLGH